ncbi:MAG: M23 family metallopeptidase [Chloroflexota bacterium]
MRLHSERVVPIGAAAILLVASVLSYAPAPSAGENQGGPVALGSEPRLAVGGSNELQFEPVAAGDESYAPIEVAGLLGGREVTTPASGPGPLVEPGAQSEPQVDGAFLDDGTLLKPIAVDTSIADSSGMLERYKVQSGDTLVGIADKFDVSMMTVWWANKLSSKNDLKVGQVLVVPPVTGLVATVKEGDTLEGLAKTYGIDPAEIVETNQLDDPTLVIGQTVILPGAAGAGIPTPKPTPKRVVSSSGNARAPVTYSGGAFVWPVVGGNNYISQYFRYGHYGLDIAATYGSTVRAGAAGTVLYAGWRSNGGGYQVWIGHGSGLYTTYNHMAGVSVGTGQGVARGQQVGRVGSSGYATGPHLHFEVWTGPIWNGGSRVNPLRYF